MIRAGNHITRWLGHCSLAGLMALTGAAAMAQTEQVLVKRAAELRDAPGDSAKSLGALPVQTPVMRLGERQGPWIKVNTAGGATGWVHMFDVASPNAPAQGGNAAAGALRGITSFFNKGSAQAPANSYATSTVGIRGLGAEDIANAQPNPAAVGRAEALRLDAGQARQFAMQASLNVQNVEPLPVPAKPRAPANTNQTFNQGNTP
ncbi:hypothetical protein BH11PSE7_BH11PSE7_23850 [soil metagenome]